MKTALIASMLASASLLPTKFTPPQNDTKITYSKDIKPILTKNCYSCHVPGNSFVDFSTYKKAYSLRFRIQDRVNSREMPYDGNFVDFEKSRELINQWVSGGANK